MQSGLRAFLILALTTFHVVGADEWPEFRGPTGQGTSTATNVPLHWSATSNVVWKTPILGNGWSSPILSQGRLYLTSAVESSGATSLRVWCVDAKSGRVIWNVEALRPDPTAAQTKHKKNSQASSTPIVRDGKIYAHFGHLGTVALDLSGKVLWTQTELKYPPLHGNGGSPVLLDDTLVFSCDGTSSPFVAALDAKSGRVKWKTPRNTSAARTFSFSTPLTIEVEGQRQVISAGSGFVGGYDPRDGREIWRLRYGEGYSVVPRPVFAKELLFVSSGFDRPSVFAINPKGAKGDVTDSHAVWTHQKGAPNTPSMLVAGDQLYFVSDSGIASCLDALSGKVHWSERLSGGYSASPVFADGRIYFQNELGLGVVVAAGTTFQLLAENNIEERTFASPAVADGALFVRSESHLWRIAH